MDRDPRVDPINGDVLFQTEGQHELHVDDVTSGEVSYRVTDRRGVTVLAVKVPLYAWRETAWYAYDGHQRTEVWTLKKIPETHE